MRRARLPARRSPPVDLALHLGDALYGNVGAIDRLDFTVIGPAINEVARIEALCEPLGRAVLVSAEFVAGMKAADAGSSRLAATHCAASGSAKEIFALDLGASADLAWTSRGACRAAHSSGTPARRMSSMTLARWAR